MSWVLLALLLAPPRAAILENARALEGFPASRKMDRASSDTMAKAEEAVKGTAYFYGRTPVKIGLKDIDWSGAHIHHQEWPAQLNRFYHMDALAAAYRATGEERFARAARAYIEDWLREDHYDTATSMRPGDNTLTMSIRLGSSMTPGWGGMLPVFLKSPSFDDAFVDRVLASIGHQADYLSRHLTPLGNWRIAQLDALVFTALRFPSLPNAQRLLKDGIAGMHSALVTQFLADGVHIERTPGYADWMTDVYANYVQLGRLRQDADARVDPRVLARALDYGAQSQLFGVNDSTAPVRDPAVLGRLRSRSETLARLGIEAPAEPPLDQVFSVAGQVFMRTGWQPGADYMAFDASTWGGGHGHLSRLSLVLRSKGRVLVADPGILSYEMSDPYAPYGKSTPAHSTLNVNGGNQSGADAQLLRTGFSKEAALVQARYQGGYWPGKYGWGFTAGRGAGSYGDHERILFWVKGEYAVVIDSMTADAGAQIRNVWQLGPMEKWQQDREQLTWWSENADVNLLVRMAVAPPGAVMETFEGSKEPIRGWIGAHGDDHVAAPLVEYRYPSTRWAVTSVVLLAPYTGARPQFAIEHSAANGIHRLRVNQDEIAWSDGLQSAVDGESPFTWQRGPASFRLR